MDFFRRKIKIKMALSPRIQTDIEKYHCPKCETYYQFKDVHLNWKCPVCNHILNIKVSVDNYLHNCQRVTPEELKIEELVTLENEHIHEILNISKNQNEFRVALKEYRVITLKSNDYVTRIDGTWSLG